MGQPKKAWEYVEMNSFIVPKLCLPLLAANMPKYDLNMGSQACQQKACGWVADVS